jgi:uncharacterized damage-inducible protein DinB
MNPIPEFDMEAANTRKTLERVPEDKLDYKPHEKCGTLGWMAGHIADIPGWGAVTLTTDGMEFDGMQPPASPKTTAELLERFDRNVQECRAALEKADEATLSQTWTGTMKGKPVMSARKGEMMRGMIMNHIIHHRAQLTMYLRMLDVPVPALYGPSADEPFVPPADQEKIAATT